MPFHIFIVEKLTDFEVISPKNENFSTKFPNNIQKGEKIALFR